MYDKNSLSALEYKLSESSSRLESSKVIVGFDGYIDKLVRIPKEQGYFSSISEFISHISAFNNQSADLKVERISERMGGNGPLLAASLAEKGAFVTCIGAMGLPEINHRFSGLSKNCEVITIEDPAECFSLEFADGKLMFGDTDPLERIDYQLVCNRVGDVRLKTALDKCDLFCFTNWSGVQKSNELLSGIAANICPYMSVKPRILFFDLADPSAQQESKFNEFFELLSVLNKHFTIILGLNIKEFLQIYNRFFRLNASEILPEMPSKLLEAFPVQELVIHGLDYAVAGDRTHQMQFVPGEYIKYPHIVTGGGDNFNAGYCAGKLLDLAPTECALLGNISSMLYVRDGCHASLLKIIDYIRTY